MASPDYIRSFLHDCIETACVLEATARKPGNVHPAQSFVDLEYSDFVRSAQVIGPILADVGHCGVGESIRLAALVTKQRVARNTNLGILLLIAPLAAVPIDCPIADGIADVLASFDETDAAAVFEAIRIAQPGGMGQVDNQDITQPPLLPLVECMGLAADRDTIALQYTNGFQQILQGTAQLQRCLFDDCWEQTVIQLQLSLLSSTPDTLIARKCGIEVARQISKQAADLMAVLPDNFDANHPALLNFDRHLRLDGHRLNPGTTADLVAACLFVALRERTIEWSGRIDVARVASQFATNGRPNTPNQ